MKKIISAFLLLLCSFNLFAMLDGAGSSGKLRVATYGTFLESLGGEKGIIKLFEEMSGIDVELVDIKSQTNLSNALNNGIANADIIIGVTESDVVKCKQKFFEAKILDYGFYGFCFDTRSGLTPPRSFADLEKEEYKDKIILIDPRTSSVGYGLLLWSVSALGEKEAFKWWKKVIGNSYAVTSSWSSAYSMFVKGNAPLIISYATTPVYHYMNGVDYITNLIFKDGSITTDEYVCIMRTTKKLLEAKTFFEFLLNNSDKVALANTMYPARNEVALPDAYKRINKPTKILLNSSADFNDDPYLLQRWVDDVALSCDL